MREGRADEARAAYDDLQQRYDRAAAGADDLAMLAAVLGDWTSARSWLAKPAPNARHSSATSTSSRRCQRCSRMVSAGTS